MLFTFRTESDARFLQLAPKYGLYLRSVVMCVDQKFDYNRKNACQAIIDISKYRNLRFFQLRFVGDENPTFYSGKEFLDALWSLFAAVNQRVEGTSESIDQDQSVCGKDDGDSSKAKIARLEDVDESSNLSSSSLSLYANPFDPNRITEGQLRDVDLSGFSVCIDDSLISLLAKYHHNLEKLNIQNQVLVVKVSAASILQVVQNCRKLCDLRLFMCSVSQQAIECLADDLRVPLQHLSLKCCRYEKYTKDIERNAWRLLVKQHPGLQVTLIFDHTCPLYRIREIMKSEIPVVVLRLETQTTLCDEVLQAANFYADTLQKVVIRAPPTRIGPSLDSAVLTMAENCQKLTAFHVFCVLEKATIERIYELHPVMTSRGAYTLKDTPEPHPWTAGNDA